MSVSIGNLFNFSRSLPEPFDKLANKKVKISSEYGSGTEATLCCTMIKAVHAVCNCMTGTGEGAVGSIDHRTVAEYKSSAGSEMYHLVVFDSGSGNIMASVYDKNTEAIENYKLHQSDKDGAAVMMDLMPLLLKDDEFDDNFQTYFDQRNAGYPDMKKATDAMAILCDNAYRRIKDDTCPTHIKVTLDKSGNVMRVSQSHLLAGVYTPNSVLAGEFTIFAKTGKVTVSAARASIDHKDFVGKYQLTGSRKLSVLEETLVPKLEEWYIIPDEIVDICKHALNTTGKPMQMRNFLLRGPAGTGKTQGAKAIAAGLHLPYMKYTCSASTEVFDFVGMVFPTMKPTDMPKNDKAEEKVEKTPFSTPVEKEEKIDFSKVEIEPLFSDFVDFETFSKSDFRAVKVLACEAVKKSKKLLKFTLDDGTGVERTILSGIHAYYEPEELVGKTLLAITNLPPRPMMGIESCGMLISAVHHEEGEEKLHLLMLDGSIPAGAKMY